MEEAIKKADALIEALPYIQRFHEKIVVIKFGGSAMQDPDVFDGILEDVAFLATVGARPVVVHGGGARISEGMSRRGLEPTFVRGHRVTDAESLEVACEVLGKTSEEIVSKIKSFGAGAESLFHDGDTPVQARKKRLLVEGEEKDLGYVGEVAAVDTEAFLEVTCRGVVPVVPPLGRDETGQLYNINADTAAAAIAVSLRAEKLVFLSNVHGIMSDPADPGSLLTTVDESQAEKLIEKEVISGGMLPKVRASLETLQKGVHKAHIIDGRLPHSLLLEIFTRRGVGTQIVE